MAKRNPSKNTKRNDSPVTLTQLLPKITEDTTRITVSSGTEITEITEITENNFGKSRVTASNEITIQEKKIRPFTKHENTLYHPEALHKMVCIRALPQAVHSQYIYPYKTNIRMRQDV